MEAPRPARGLTPTSLPAEWQAELTLAQPCSGSAEKHSSALWLQGCRLDYFPEVVRRGNTPTACTHFRGDCKCEQC